MVDEFKKELGALIQNGEFVWMDVMGWDGRCILYVLVLEIDNLGLEYSLLTSPLP